MILTFHMEPGEPPFLAHKDLSDPDTLKVWFLNEDETGELVEYPVECVKDGIFHHPMGWSQPL